MACVEIRKLYGGQRGTRVRGFDLVIQNPEIHVVLCTSISALDELVHIMYGTALYKSGTFKLNGKDARRGSGHGPRRCGAGGTQPHAG